MNDIQFQAIIDLLKKIVGLLVDIKGNEKQTISGDPDPKIWFKYKEAPAPTKIENERPSRHEAEMLKEFLSPEDYQDAIAMSRGGTD